MWQYDPKIMRARSRFEGVSTPRNEWNRRLRTKTALEQQSSRTCTFERKEGKSRHHPRGANAKMRVHVPVLRMIQGKDGPRANLQRFCELTPVPSANPHYKEGNRLLSYNPEILEL